MSTKREIIDHKKGMLQITAFVGLVLLVPLIAMQFTREVQWGVLDFAIIGALLLGSGMVYEFGIRSVKKTWYRGGLTGLLILAVIAIWVELAVGIFD